MTSFERPTSNKVKRIVYLVNASEMQQMDRETIETFGIPGRVLMENAGRGAAAILVDTLVGASPPSVGVMAGRGNNGGDGFVIARCLAQRGIPVTVYLLAERSRVGGDAAANLGLLDPLGIPLVELGGPEAFSAQRAQLERHDIWVDAILGTGLTSDVRGFFKDVINWLNGSGKAVFAVDIPSGLDSDTGQPRGTCVRAAVTATFGFAKTGQLVYPGPTFVGRLHIVDIGIPPHIARTVGPRQHLLTGETLRDELPARAPDAHKGRTGHLLVLAGSPGKTGAAVMTAMGALRAGAGLVTLGVPQSLHPILETQVLEAMTAPIPDGGSGLLLNASAISIEALAAGKRCLAIGPGIGTAPGTRELVLRLAAGVALPMVIDADGLNCLAGRLDVLRQRPAPTVLTPHPGEMGRLLDCPPAAVQADRVACARKFASEFGVVLVLKGAATVIAQPDGQVFINSTGNAGMAAGGMGDVLTGLIAGLASQGLPAAAAARLGVYLHGAAADHLAQSNGPWGYLASEVMAAIPGQIARLFDLSRRDGTTP